MPTEAEACPRPVESRLHQIVLDDPRPLAGRRPETETLELPREILCDLAKLRCSSGPTRRRVVRDPVDGFSEATGQGVLRRGSSGTWHSVTIETASRVVASIMMVSGSGQLERYRQDVRANAGG